MADNEQGPSVSTEAEDFPTSPWPALRVGMMLVLIIAGLCLVAHYWGLPEEQESAVDKKPAPVAGMKLPASGD